MEIGIYWFDFLFHFLHVAESLCRCTRLKVLDSYTFDLKFNLQLLFELYHGLKDMETKLVI